VLLLGAAPASAANRFAEVGGDGPEPCLASDPCSLVTAVNSAAANDDVTLLGGLSPDPYVTSTALVVASNVTVHGTPGALAVIETDVGNAPAVTLGAGSVLRDVDVEHTGTNFAAVVLSGGGTLERVISHASGGSTAGGCQTAEGGSPVIRDSVCWHDGSGGNGGGVEGRNASTSAQTLTLRNVTAIATNARPAIRATRVDGGALTINATNVIAQSSTGPDVGYTAGFTPNAITLDHSNYDSEDDVNNVITNPGTGTAAANQTTAPVFVAAGDFRQSPTSTGTIDLGTTSGQLMGELDLEAQERSVGAPDIGADELGHETSTSIACVPASLTLGAGSSSCTATVFDTVGALLPTGEVAFASSGTGTFGGGACTLAFVSDSVASCEITYTPAAVGNDQITGSYPGDASHEESQGSTAVGIASPAGPGPGTGSQSTSFDLKAAIRKCKKKFPKGKKRKKCLKRAKKRASA
jgi:hypothetical protein